MKPFRTLLALGLSLLAPPALASNISGSIGGGTVPGSACGDSTHAIGWNGSAYTCQAITGSATPGGASGQLQYNNSGALGGVTGAASNGTLVTFANSDLQLGGSGVGVTTFSSANAGASNFTLTLPAATDTVAELGQSQSFTGTNTFTNANTFALGAITTNTRAVNITATFNASSATFDAPLFANITNTASAAGSRAVDFQVGGNAYFGILATGGVFLGNYNGTGAGGVYVEGPSDAYAQGGLCLTSNITCRGLIYSSSNNIAISPTNGGDLQLVVHNTGTTVVDMPDSTTGIFKLLPNLSVPTGGVQDEGLLMSSTAHLGIFFGSGAPTLSAAQGSLYIRTDGTSTSTRLYVNTNGTTGWTNLASAT